jgi:hypothetical protein
VCVIPGAKEGDQLLYVHKHAASASLTHVVHSVVGWFKRKKNARRCALPKIMATCRDFAINDAFPDLRM